jgi:hypothetical protein
MKFYTMRKIGNYQKTHGKLHFKNQGQFNSSSFTHIIILVFGLKIERVYVKIYEIKSPFLPKCIHFELFKH